MLPLSPAPSLLCAQNEILLQQPSSLEPPSLRFDIVSLFPDFFSSPLKSGLIGKALEREIASVHITNPRDFTTDKHHKVDDIPYGGGVGMVMKPEPVFAAHHPIGWVRHALAYRPDQRVLPNRVPVPVLSVLVRLGSTAFKRYCPRHSGAA